MERICLVLLVLAMMGFGDQNATRAGLDPRAPTRFEPPADGRLTDAHVRMYLTVRRASQAFVREPQPSTSPERFVEDFADSAESEVAAARRVGVDPGEYRWVRARIAEATAADARPGDALLAQIDAQVQASTASLQEKAQEPGDSRSLSPADPAAVAYNRQLLGKYQRELDALSKRR